MRFALKLRKSKNAGDSSNKIKSKYIIKNLEN